MMATVAEAQLITSEEFVTDVLCELALQDQRFLRLVDTLEDKRFSSAFERLNDRAQEFGLALDFSLATNPYHGDSSTLREALYSLRERGVVAINNPRFKTVEIKLDHDDAEHYLSRSAVPRDFIRGLVSEFFSGGDGGEIGVDRVTQAH